MRLACWRSRPRDRELSCVKPSPRGYGVRKDRFGATPKPAREMRALPDQRELVLANNQLSASFKSASAVS
jgi:hypothetical protein